MARVLVVAFSVVPGPDRHGVQLLHVVRALASRFTVDVLSLRVGELAYVERFHKTRMLRVPVPDGPLPARVDAFRRAVRRQLDGAEYDLVLFRDAWSGLPALERCAPIGVKTIFDVARSAQGDLALVDAAQAAELAHDEAVCWERADLVLVPTESARRFVSQRLPAAAQERVVLVPPGVDVDRFDAEPAPAEAVPVVVCAGTLAAGRGVRVLLRAFRDVVDRMPARLVLAGALEREFMEPLGTALDQLDLASRVELVGAVDNEDLPRVIARAAVCVAPAAPDLAERPTACFPTKILEYLACRRAVVAPRKSSVRDVIQDGVEGLLFDAQNPKDLADKLLRLLGDPHLRERLADAGQRRARSRFPSSLMRRRLIEATLRLLPATAWNPVTTSAARLGPGTGSSSPAVRGEDAAVPSDTNPILPDDGDTGATVITLSPATEETAPGAHDPTPSDGEAWVVLTAEITGMTRVGRAQGADTDGGDGTPSDGIAPPPVAPLQRSFVAGELEARPAAPAELDFQAASDLLSGGGEAGDGAAATVRSPDAETAPAPPAQLVRRDDRS